MGIDTLIGMTCVTAAIFFSISGLLAVRKWFETHNLAPHHDVTDPLSQVVSVMFALLLGFMISNSMQRFQTARSTVQQEAASLADIFNAAGALQDQTKQDIRMLCMRYADQIINEEWGLLSQKNISVGTLRTYRSIWDDAVSYQPKNQWDSNAHQSLLSSLISMSDARRLRIEALHNGLPMALWCIMLLGGLATIVFTYFFGAKDVRLQVIMTGMVTLVISLNIFLLYTFDDPFEGDIMINPTAFQTDLMMFRQYWNVNSEGREEIPQTPPTSKPQTAPPN